MKHELVKWLFIELNVGMVMGLNLGRTKLGFFLSKLLLAWIWKGRENSSWMGSQGRLEK